MTSRTDRGRDVVRQTFGGALYQQGRGFYSALELLAIVRGEVLLEGLEERIGASADRVLPVNGPARYVRPSHDHARRLLVATSDVVPGVFADAETREAVRSLLRGIEAPVPGRRRAPDKWQLRHFYPYPAEAVHYDAVERRGRISVERYQFRGAGGLAHKILRTDPDSARLIATRSRFRDLLKDGESSVGTLLSALSRHDAEDWRPADDSAGPESIFEDPVETRSLSVEDGSGAAAENETRWMRLLREGVHRLLHRDGISDFDRIEGLMHWTPWCIGMHQLSMARRAIGVDEDAMLVFDAGHRASPIRSLARRHLGEATGAIKGSLHTVARNAGLHELTTGSASWWTGPRSFFTTTMFAVGALNANSGRRHFEVRPRLLQTIVHALVDDALPLARFSEEVLGQELRILCDRESASGYGLAGVDRRHLLTNGEHLATRLDEVGLMRAFSDSTRMVGVHE